MSLLKKPVVLAVSLAVAAAALYWFWPSAEPLLGQDKLLQANLARDNDQRGKDQEEHVLLWPIIPGLCQFLCG